MASKKIFFEKDHPVHILAHANEGKITFKDINDCYRFIFQMHAANLGSPILNLNRYDIKKAAQSLLDGEEMSSNFIIEQHEPLVYFLDFSLVVNHYHFYLVPTKDNTIPIYMQKLNGGFGKYFNLKYNKKGQVFEGGYKSIPIETDTQSDIISRYVSIKNPLDVYQPDWRENGLADSKKSFEFIANYQFSSFPDKIGARSSKILAPKEILEKYSSFINKKDYKEFVREFLNEKLNTYSNLYLE